MNSKQSPLEDIPTPRTTIQKRYNFWGAVELNEFGNVITASPNENCNEDNPLYLLAPGMPDTNSGIPISIKPGQFITVYALCQSDDGVFLPSKNQFYVEASFCTELVVENCIPNCDGTVRSSEAFDQQDVWTAFTVRIPKNVRNEQVLLQCALCFYNPDTCISVDTQHVVT